MTPSPKIEVRVDPALLELVDGALGEEETRSDFARKALVAWLDRLGHSTGRNLDRPPRTERPRVQVDRVETVEVAVEEKTSAPEPAEVVVEDVEGHEEFLARRSKQLYGQGMTRKIAQRVAQKEWEDGKR